MPHRHRRPQPRLVHDQSYNPDPVAAHAHLRRGGRKFIRLSSFRSALQSQAAKSRARAWATPIARRRLAADGRVSYADRNYQVVISTATNGVPAILQIVKTARGSGERMPFFGGDGKLRWISTDNRAGRELGCWRTPKCRAAKKMLEPPSSRWHAGHSRRGFHVRRAGIYSHRAGGSFIAPAAVCAPPWFPQRAAPFADAAS